MVCSFCNGAHAQLLAHVLAMQRNPCLCLCLAVFVVAMSNLVLFLLCCVNHHSHRSNTSIHIGQANKHQHGRANGTLACVPPRCGACPGELATQLVGLLQCKSKKKLKARLFLPSFLLSLEPRLSFLPLPVLRGAYEGLH